MSVVWEAQKSTLELENRTLADLLPKSPSVDEIIVQLEPLKEGDRDCCGRGASDRHRHEAFQVSQRQRQRRDRCRWADARVQKVETELVTKDLAGQYG